MASDARACWLSRVEQGIVFLKETGEMAKILDKHHIGRHLSPSVPPTASAAPLYSGLGHTLLACPTLLAY